MNFKMHRVLHTYVWFGILLRICSAKSELFLGWMEKFCVEITYSFCRVVVADGDYCFYSASKIMAYL